MTEENKGTIETRGLEGESDPNWWKQPKVEGTTEISPELRKVLNDDIPVTLGATARFLSQIQNSEGTEAAAALLKAFDHHDGTRMLLNPKKRKESPATRKYRNVMSGLIARAAK